MTALRGTHDIPQDLPSYSTPATVSLSDVRSHIEKPVAHTIGGDSPQLSYDEVLLQLQGHAAQTLDLSRGARPSSNRTLELAPPETG